MPELPDIPVCLHPNAETIEAIEAARRGEFEGHGSMSDLFAELDSDDSSVRSE